MTGAKNRLRRHAFRVLLITPSDLRAGFEYLHSGRENVGVEYLLSSLRSSGHFAESLNQNLPGERSLENVDLRDYDVIGFSLPFWGHRQTYTDLINRIHREIPVPLIAGGHAATIGADYFLAKCPGLAGVVMGEGEETILELLSRSAIAVAAVPGFYTRSGFERRILGSIDDIVPPVRDELTRALAQNPRFKEAYVVSTRGCHNSCSFCSIPAFYKESHSATWRERSVENVGAEIENLTHTFPQLDSLSFTDDNFFGFQTKHLRRGVAIAERINVAKPGITFEITCRADLVDREVFETLSGLGLYGVYLGIESGVQRILDVFRKRTTVVQNLRSIQILSEVGIGCDVGFIMFSPTITIGEVSENLLFLQHLVTDYPIYVHPAATFRELQIYPNDLGKSAIARDIDYSLDYDSSVNTLKTVLQECWKSQFQREFILLEDQEITGVIDSDTWSREVQRITLSMIDIGIRLVREVKATPSANAIDLARIFACEDPEVQ